MTKLRLYYATNRRHVGDNRWRPESYDTAFSSDGMENLRLGKLSLEADSARVERYFRKSTDAGRGDGEGLSGYLGKLAGNDEAIDIRAFREKLSSAHSDVNQPLSSKYGSSALFAELQKVMTKSSDVLIYIHGYNVAWEDAVGSALALQEMLNRNEGAKKTTVVLFSWPSDGSALPFLAYRSDRADAESSGGSVGRAILKLRDFLMSLHQKDSALCGHELHLLCHSMGNYVMQNAISKIDQHTPGPAMPRIFEHIFLCSSDVEDTVLETGQPMGRLHELSRNVTVYYNSGDAALYVSDYTKGNSDRLGTAGSAHPNAVHNKVHQVDCSDVVGGVIEHSYYLSGRIADDISQSIGGAKQFDDDRSRKQSPAARNTWTMV
ncbi:MAG: esterase/lipase superfamily enzyme [Pseudohongiellaceae bacterium]|jgi:esterase/lipase superfamily enzyme